ncbi:MAG: hypothetical protein ACRBN8_07540 [Nannocystales bacterium]
MSRLLPLTLLATLCAIGTGTGCYSERLPPPYFRNTCGSDNECGEGTSCVSGLCQVECTMATADEDCGTSPQHLACINGVCVSACSPDDDACPGSQSCTEIPTVSELIGAGLCMEECSADSCPDGELCIAGFCATTCDPTDAGACGQGQICPPGVGVCIPEDLPETTAGSDGDTDGDSDGGTEGDTE